MIVAPLIVTVVSGLIFEWYRSRSRDEKPVTAVGADKEPKTDKPLASALPPKTAMPTTVAQQDGPSNGNGYGSGSRPTNGTSRKASSALSRPVKSRLVKK